MNDGCEQWWDRVNTNKAWDSSLFATPWNRIGLQTKDMLRAIYEAAILPQDEDDRELREQAANLTRHPWERGENKEESR